MFIIFLGQVCLPGGMKDKSDSSLYVTALREAEEEVNLKPHQVNFVGFLHDYVAYNIFRKQYDLCSAVMATLAVDVTDLELRPNEEVADIFWMPLKHFLGGGLHHWQENNILGDFIFHSNFFRYSCDGKVFIVWGITAMFCIAVATILLQEPTHFPYTPLGAVPIGLDSSPTRSYMNLVLRNSTSNSSIPKAKL